MHVWKRIDVHGNASFVKTVIDVFSSEAEEVRYEYKTVKNIQNVVRFIYSYV